MIIAVDFDGTCVTHEYPLIGLSTGAIPVLKELVHAGHELIIYTMRSGYELEMAEMWFSENMIKLYASQINPTQHEWTSSPKCYAQLYIDDAALGIPLIYDDKFASRPYVDWPKVRSLLVEKGLLSEEMKWEN